MSRRMYLPAPTVYEGPDQCPSCLGRCVTGEQYGMQSGSGTTIVVDALCPVCGGCGRDQRHASCTPEQHADWKPGDCYEEKVDERACASCDGRQWVAVFGWTQGAGPDREQLTYYLRVPCGCAEPLMVPLDDEEDEPKPEPEVAADQPRPDALTYAIEVQGAMGLVLEISDAARACIEAAPRLSALAVAAAVADDPDVVGVWGDASDWARRDALTAFAEQAARHDVDPDSLVDELPALHLLELAAMELAKEPEKSLLPDGPWMPATGPTGIFAMSTVCDSTEPEEPKLRAAAVLCAAAIQAEDAADNRAADAWQELGIEPEEFPEEGQR